MNNEQPIIVGLDIGTTKIAVIAGRKNEFGKLEILGFGKSNSNGVKHGQVLNIDETIKAIKSALENCLFALPGFQHWRTCNRLGTCGLLAIVSPGQSRSRGHGSFPHL